MFRYSLGSYGALRDAFVRTSLLAIAIASMPALAQENIPSRELASDEAATHDEIIVTAQRRAQRLDEVPASLTVINGGDLVSRGVTRINDLTQVIPGLTFVNNGFAASPSIRGISTQGAGAGSENPVPLYIDGAYLASQHSQAFDLPDVERVEVLKGPQGTLYGRNATAGAILITTKEPGFRTSGYAIASYARFDEIEAKGFVSTPIVPDAVAVSLAGAYRRNDGYVYDLIKQRRHGRTESTILRGKLLVVPTEDVKVTFSAYYIDRYDANSFLYAILGGNAQGRASAPDAIIATRPLTSAYDLSPFAENKVWGGSAKIVADVSIGTLTSTTGYTKSRFNPTLDLDYTSANLTRYSLNLPQRTINTDLSLASRKYGPASFLIGMNYVDDKASYAPLQINEVNRTWARVDTEALAFYGSIDINITGKIVATGGGRFSLERRSLSGAVGLTPAFPLLGKVKFENFSPSFSMRYDIEGVGNAYATYTRGFKSGEFGVAALNRVATRPEHVTAYEIGFKSRRFGNFSFDLAAFYYDYRNIIVTVSQGSFNIVTNAAEARSKGIEANAAWDVTPDLTVAGGFSWLDAKYTRFPNGIANIPKVPAGTSGFSAAQSCPVNRHPCGNFTSIFDLTGNHLPRAPKYTFNISAAYKREIGDGELSAQVNLFHSDGFFWEVGNRIEAPSYTLVNGRIAFKPNRDGPLTLTIFGKNLTNADYHQAATVGTTSDAVAYGPPRTFGGSVSVEF